MANLIKTFDSHGTYICDLCGKRTRNVGGEEAKLKLCKSCMEECEHDNAVSDGDIDPATGKPYTNEPRAEQAGLCPNCHGDSDVTEDPDTVFYCGSCGCVWGEGRQPRLLEREAVPMMMLAGQWPPHPMLGERVEKARV